MFWLLFLILSLVFLIVSYSAYRKFKIRESSQKINSKIVSSFNLDEFNGYENELMKYADFLNENSKNCYSLALAAIVKNEFELATSLIRKATYNSIQKNEIAVNILYTRGCYLHLMGNYKRASACFTRAYKIKQQNISIINNYAIRLFNCGEIDAAILLFNKSIQLENKKNDYALLYLAKCFDLKGRIDEAYESFSKINLLNVKNNDEIFIGSRLSEIAMMRNDFKDCLKYCEAVLKLKKDNAVIIDRLIMIQAAVQKYKEASFELNKIYNYFSYLFEGVQDGSVLLVRERLLNSNGSNVSKEIVSGVQGMINYFESKKELEIMNRVYSYFSDGDSFKSLILPNSTETVNSNCTNISYHLLNRNYSGLISFLKPLNKRFPNNISLKVVQIFAQFSTNNNGEMVDILVNGSYLENLAKFESPELRFFIGIVLFYLRDKSNSFTHAEKMNECTQLLHIKKTSNLYNELAIAQWVNGYEKEALKSFQLSLSISRNPESNAAYNLRKIRSIQSVVSSNEDDSFSTMDWQTAKELRGKGSYKVDIVLPVKHLVIPEDKDQFLNESNNPSEILLGSIGHIGYESYHYPHLLRGCFDQESDYIHFMTK